MAETWDSTLNSGAGGWDATNIETRRAIRIRSAARLRPDTTAEPDPDICATAGCAQPTALIYLGRPRCQECYAVEVEANDEAPRAKKSRAKPEPDGDRNALAGYFPRVAKNGAHAAAATPKPPTAAKARKKTAKRSDPAKAAKRPTRAKTARQKRQRESNAAPTPMSALAAAAEVLRTSEAPMNCVGLVAPMAERGLWTSPGGKTPHATLHAAMDARDQDQGPRSPLPQSRAALSAMR